MAKHYDTIFDVCEGLPMMLKVIYVVVQFYPWFKFSFLLFQTHYYVIIIHYHTQKQKKRKLEPRIKLNHNINNIKTLKFSFLGCFRRLKQYNCKLLKIAKKFPELLVAEANCATL